MNTFAKLISAPALAAALALGAAPVSAAGDDGIVVTSPGAMKAWQEQTTDRLNRQLDRVDAFSRGTALVGTVQIRFTLDDQGRPSNFETVHASGDQRAIRDARMALRNLRGLDEAPVTNVGDAVFQANMIFARDGEEKERLLAELTGVESQRLAAGGSRATVTFGT
ncbi:energy transducer TonB family protein [Qipengyuania zhejiangensis]|uniref:energy transducer TonB family protein n=1 Tax=Qipengyuania zhejiangensis TaxID=3077782 RepID=UPI002D79B81A|nr:energy transducer TonB [Qipengyuania sp. Z2]